MFSLLKHPLHTYKVLSGPSFAIYQMFNIKKIRVSHKAFNLVLCHFNSTQNLWPECFRMEITHSVKIMVIFIVSFILNFQPFV